MRFKGAIVALRNADRVDSKMPLRRHRPRKTLSRLIHCILLSLFFFFFFFFFFFSFSEASYLYLEMRVARTIDRQSKVVQVVIASNC